MDIVPIVPCMRAHESYKNQHAVHIRTLSLLDQKEIVKAKERTTFSNSENEEFRKGSITNMNVLQNTINSSKFKSVSS